MEGHIVERCEGEDNPRVTCFGRVSLVGVQIVLWSSVPIRFGIKRKIFSVSTMSSIFAVAGLLGVPFPLALRLVAAIVFEQCVVVERGSVYGLSEGRGQSYEVVVVDKR